MSDYQLSSILTQGRVVHMAVIGCGGTGSAFASGLPYLHQAMRALGLHGLEVTLMDGDLISETNCVRQPFSRGEVGMHKSIVLASRFSRLASTMLLCMPTSPRLKGCRTQLVSLIRSPSIRVTSRPWRPKARIAWCRYGNPDAKALPVPPQPMTAMWTARPCVRIELSLYS